MLEPTCGSAWPEAARLRRLRPRCGFLLHRTRLTEVTARLPRLMHAAVRPRSAGVALKARLRPRPAAHRRLLRAPGPSLVVSALTGAALLTAADVVAQHLSVSTGLVTVTLGGLYFIWLLIREYRRS